MRNIKRRKYKLNLKRVGTNIFILFAIFTAFSFVTTINFGKKELNTEKISVHNQDTLWNISKYICDNTDNKNLNVQNVILEIKDINNLSSSDIYNGQVLDIPVY